MYNAVDRWKCALVLSTLLWAFGFATQVAFAESNWSTSTLAGGTPFETPVVVQETGVPGPAVMIVGGMHGNEPAGALAAGEIADWPMSRGTLIVVPRANVPALDANKRYTPDVPEAENNLNRNFVWKDEQVQTQGQMAAELWELVQTYQPTWVIDLHEGFDVHAKNNKSSVHQTTVAHRCAPRSQSRRAPTRCSWAARGRWRA